MDDTTPKRRGNPNFGKQPVENDNKQSQASEPNELDELRQLVKDQGRMIDALKEVQDQGKLRAAEVADDPNDHRFRVTLRTYKGEIVTKWEDMNAEDNDVYYNEGREYARQYITFYTANPVFDKDEEGNQVGEGKTKHRITYKAWTDSYKITPRYPVNTPEPVLDRFGNYVRPFSKNGQIFTVELPDGKEIQIHEKFTN